MIKIKVSYTSENELTELLRYLRIKLPGYEVETVREPKRTIQKGIHYTVARCREKSRLKYKMLRNAKVQKYRT